MPPDVLYNGYILSVVTIWNAIAEHNNHNINPLVPLSPNDEGRELFWVPLPSLVRMSLKHHHITSAKRKEELEQQPEAYINNQRPI